MEILTIPKESVTEEYYDMAKEVRDFEETRAGVKGLVDSGVVKIPRFFIHPPDDTSTSTTTTTISSPPSITTTNGGDVDAHDQLQIPVIDLRGTETNGCDHRRIRNVVVEQLRDACERWGFFQMVNHGVELGVLEGILEGTRRFHEQPNEAKMEFYSDDPMQKVRFYSTNGPHRESTPAMWRDSLACTFPDDTLDSVAIPLISRKEVEEYVKCMIKLRETLCELLSEALGLSSDYLDSIECMKSEYLTCLYYPACPEPDLTLGTVKHSDPTFLTILVQDAIGGLQVLHQNHWVNVPPVHGALLVNIGDLMQLISNDKFRSAQHRVLAGPVGPRVSAACFFYPSTMNAIKKPYGPIKKLISDDNNNNSQAIYKDVLYYDYVAYYQSKPQDGISALDHFKL